MGYRFNRNASNMKPQAPKSFRGKEKKAVLATTNEQKKKLALQKEATEFVAKKKVIKINEAKKSVVTINGELVGKRPKKLLMKQESIKPLVSDLTKKKKRVEPMELELLEDPAAQTRDYGKKGSPKVIRKNVEARTEKFLTTFQEDSLRIRKLLQQGQNDNAISLFQKSTLSTIIDLITIAERQYRKKKVESSAYALNSLISQARELIADLEARHDRLNMASNITREVLQPQFMRMASNIINTLHNTKRSIEPYVKNEKAVNDKVDEAARSIALFLEELFVDTQVKIEAKMSE